MLGVSQQFKEAMVAPVRTFKAEADVRINPKDMSEVSTFTHEDYIKSIEIQRVGDNSKFFGFGICQRLNMKIVDLEDAYAPNQHSDIKVRLGIQLPDGGTEFISFPTFRISERNRMEEEGELSITAYDRLDTATQHTLAELALQAPYTIKMFCEEIAAFLGVGFALENVAEDDFQFNLEYPEGGNFEGTENLRVCLNAAAEATQTIYFIDENDVLRFKRLDITGEPVATITENDYFTFHHRDNRKLTEVWHVTELGDNVVGRDSIIIPTPQYIRNNPFWTMRTDDIQQVVQEALFNAGGLIVSQFECEWRGNLPLEIGDKIEIKQVCKDGCIQPAYVFDDVITFDGGYSQKTQWSFDDTTAETDATPTNAGDIINMTFAKVDKINKQITLYASEIADNTEKIGSIVINTDSIVQSVEEINKNVEENFESINGEIQELSERVSTSMSKDDFTIEIENILTDGVEKVETSTGYTFNEEGLTIAKTDSEMSTQITENGMVVAQNGDAVLTANNEGVQAKNLHATTFLIIGESSRFEEFEENGETRVGCFWIGG